ncbi:MAG: hypothetical protein NTW87_18010 [Planctomycetota bacterium]|nr:hypothetical protein [Planctomycetota bacterium]
MAAQKVPIGLIPIQIKGAFDELFRREQVGQEYYRVYVSPSVVPDQYDVQVVWDGFEQMSITQRAVWLWERIRKVIPKATQHSMGNVSAYSAKEVVVADEIVLREQNAPIF